MKLSKKVESSKNEGINQNSKKKKINLSIVKKGGDAVKSKKKLNIFSKNYINQTKNSPNTKRTISIVKFEIVSKNNKNIHELTAAK